MTPAPVHDLLHDMQIAGGPAHQQDVMEEGDDIIAIDGIAVDENRSCH
jgi:hypothetical protein